MKCTFVVLFLVFEANLDCVAGETPSVTLKNAAKAGSKMPVVGLGTGSYPSSPAGPGEYWNNTVSEQATKAWLSVGGRRIDTCVSYHTQTGIGKAWKESGIPRQQIFITSKLDIGSDIFKQFNTTQKELQTDHVDLLLIHWPGPIPKGSTDPDCMEESQAKSCRASVWKKLEKIYQTGGALAIGVANFEVNHLQEILALKGLLPSVNQVEFHPYWHETDIQTFCKKNNIVFNGYAPLGTPDWGPQAHKWNCSILELPVVTSLAKAHKKSAAQIVLRWEWQQQVVVNPRTWNEEHMKENLQIFDFELSEDEMNQLANIPKPAVPKVCPDPHKIP